MRILFSVRNPSFVRHYDPVIRALATRGHEVLLVTERPGKQSWPSSVLALAESSPRIHLSMSPDLGFDPWWELATRLRQARFYLRFLDPAYRETPALLARARERAPLPAIRLAEMPVVGRAVRPLLARALDALEQSTRTADAFHDYLRGLAPDVIVFTPLVILKTTQLDMARAAMELGIRNIFAVASWDHLSSKGELTFSPQHAIVWNDVQKRELVDLHQFDPGHVTITGSQVFDEWFDKRPSMPREAFCARVGLRADRPFVLYLCSALLEGSAPESEFVVRWIRHLRASDHPVLRECGILIRPHFKRGEEWASVDVGALGNTVCWPPAGSVPVDAASKTDYFDSMHHAAAAVGLNTSAMIEAGIVGRPVLTVLLPELRDNQEGTIHFHYLLKGPDALLHATRSLDDHARDLANVLTGHDPDPERSRRFVTSFVRPGPSDVAATTNFVAVVETLGAAAPPTPVIAPGWARLVRPFLRSHADAAAERVRQYKAAQRRHKDEILAEHRRKRRATETVAGTQDAS